MKLGFTETAIHCTERCFCNDITEQLLAVAHNNTNWQYTCKKTPEGYLLQPIFRNMPYRNSFIPEIHVTITEKGNQTIFSLTGRPIRSVRLFVTVWCVSLLPEGVAFLFLAEGFPKFIPLFMSAVGYIMCKVSILATFRSFVKGVKKTFQ